MERFLNYGPLGIGGTGRKWGSANPMKDETSPILLGTLPDAVWIGGA